MRKGLLSFLLFVVVGLSAVQAAYDFSVVVPSGQTLYFDIISSSSSTVRVSYPGSSSSNPYYGYTEPIGNLVVPNTITYQGTTYSVTSIEGGAFSNCSGLTSVTIGNSVTSIGYYAFRGCSGLISVTIPNSVTSIGWDAFNGCSGLTSVTIPNSVTTIGSSAFMSCSSLTTLNFNAINCNNFNSDSYYYPFKYCPIATINIGDSVQRIPAYFAYNLESLTSVTIPNSVTSIGNSAFYDCDGLTSVTIPNSVTSIGEGAFEYCGGLTSVTIPNNVDTIRNSTFKNCSSLSSITIPNSVTSIGRYAFSDCSGLTTLNFNAINCGDFNSSSYHPFDNCPIATINIGDSVQRIPAYFAFNLDSLTSVNIPNSVTSIGYEAFYNCSGLTSVTIPNSVTSIGNSAFSGCSGLTSVTITNSVISIGNYAFSRCSGLTSVTIPNSVTSIGNYAFRGCTGLTSVTIPNSVTSIGVGAFENCSGLTSVTIPNSVTSIGVGAFENCSGLTSVTIPNSVTSIGEYAFSGCTGLTSVTIPNSVTSIGEYAFRGCTGLTSVTIPNSVTSIGEAAFSGCSGLTTLNFNAINCGDFSSLYHPFYNCPIATINIGDSVQQIPAYFAYYRSSLSSITIPNSIISIGNSAFRSCNSLTTLNFNAINCSDFSYNTSSSSISNHQYPPFYNCPISTINIGDSVQRIPAYFAYNLDSLTSITIPNSVTSIGNSAFYGCSGLTTLNFNAINCNNFSGGSSHPFYDSPISTINIGDSVQRIPTYFAYNRRSLSSITIPNSVTTIGNYAFSGCSGLTSVTISNSVTSIGNYAFSECSGLTSVTIPNSVTSIEWDAFNGCSGLTTVTIGNSVTSIGSSAFYGCSGLTTLNFNAINCGDFSSSSYSHPFYNCPITTINIGDSVQRIPEYFAYNLDSLTSVTIPNSVTSIGSYAFRYCNGLTTLNFNAINCSDFTYNTSSYNSQYPPFYNCPISTINIGDSVQRIPAYFAYNLDSLTSVTIGNSVTSIGSSAFRGCSGLTTLNFNAINCGNFSSSYHPFYNCPIATINIGDSVQRIPAYFAYDLESLTSITIPDSVTYIGNAAFNGCNSLSSATISSSVASIGDSAFSYCTSLDSIVIPNSVTLIGNYAFDSCSSLVSASIDSSVVTIGNSAFKDCSSLSSIIVPNSVTSIGNSAFKNCSNLFLAIISNNIEAIEDYTFYNCSSLGSITLNNSITSIGDSTFYNCSSLDTIIIPNSVTTIGKSAFGNCANLAFATISSGINSIQESTFENCNSLATITIPNSVANIADKAFNGCYNLREVVSLAVLPPALGANIFSGTAILKVPCGSLDYYTSASAGWSQYFVGIEEMCSNIVITVTSANESMGTVSGGGEYEFGTEVTITATPNQGYRFVSWNDGNTDNPRTITVTEDATYIASFEESVGIESRDMLSELAFYPNPTSGIITFNRSDIMKVEVLDAMGRTVEVYENAYTIDISKLAKGYYAMRITTAEGVAIRKVIRK